MNSPDLTFGALLAPISIESFFNDVYGARPMHVTGSSDKFRDAFSWTELNRLLDMSGLWSERSMKLVLDGRDIDASEYSSPGMTRDGNHALLPDSKLVEEYLARGATLILDFVETLSPGIRAMTRALSAGMGSAIVCNAYCSWRAHQGFMAHYDTTDVFALHFEGSKTWRIYEGVAVEPANVPGHRSFDLTPDEHASARGNLLMEVTMTPGDLLYLPRGQYHEALATSEASLHLSFGMTRATGLDFVSMFARWLRDDPCFRRRLPHFDDADEHRAFLEEVARKLRGKVEDGQLAGDVRGWQRDRAFRGGVRKFRLPDRESEPLYRVLRFDKGRNNESDVAGVTGSGGVCDLTAEQIPLIERLLKRDTVTAAELSALWSELQESELRVLVEMLLKAGVIEAI